MSDDGVACRLPGTGPSREEDLYGSDDLVRRLLANSQLWFVVGLSTNRARAAYGVARLLMSKGKTVVPIHPNAETVLGMTGFATVAEAARVHGAPDVVDCFVRSELVGPVVDAAIEAGAAAVWLQFDVIDEDAARRAQAAGVQTVMDRCPAAEWPRLGPPA
jgi:predicted CoA-binding protein